MNTFVFSLTLIVVVAILVRYVYVAWLQSRLHVTFADAPVRSLLYFSFASLLLIGLFPEEVRTLFHEVNSFGYVLLLFMVFVVFPFTYRMLRKKIGAPTWLYETFPTQTMLTLEESYVVAKVGDVVSQQLAGGIFILLLHVAGVPYDLIVFSFIGLFLLSHVYLFFTSGFIWGLYYTGLSLGGAFAIPFFILFVPAGIVWAILLHMMFYVLAGAFFAKLPRPTRAVCTDILGVPQPESKVN
ncbi:MAG: hypothetical protein AAB439_03875 [Patescibacteria group bacterium]